MPTQFISGHAYLGPQPGTAAMYAAILGTQEPNSTLIDSTVNASGAHWGLKMPGNTGSQITRTHFTNGIYRNLDMVQCSGQRFTDCTFSAGADRKPTKSKWSLSQMCDIGIKGSSSDIRFSGCVTSDLLLGDHDIYDNVHVGAKVKGVVLTDCVHPDGPHVPIIIRCLNAERPTLVRTNAVVLQYWRPVVLTYFWVAARFIDSRTQA